MELAAFPALVKRWQQERESNPAKVAASIAQMKSVQMRDAPASSTSAAASATNGSGAATPAAASATSSQPSSVAAAALPPPMSEDEQLRAMHLTGLEWSSCLAGAPFVRALQQLPSHTSRAGLQQPFSLHDLCPC
jgi:cytoskeletal protein RodZ